MLYFVGTIFGIILVAVFALIPFFFSLFVGQWVLNLFQFGRLPKFLLIMVKSLRRNLLRTSLTYLATFVLVLVVTLIWSILAFLDILTIEKTKNVKGIVSEKWQADSHMPYYYGASLGTGAHDGSRPGDIQPLDYMTWQFYPGTLDATKQTRENLVFFIAMDPDKVLTMLDDLWDDIDPKKGKHLSELNPLLVETLKSYVDQMKRNKRAVMMGSKLLKTINKRVGERFTLTGLMNFNGIDLEFEIIGIFPDGRYNDLAVMNFEYLNSALDAYPKSHGGARHPQADRSLNLVWLKLSDLKMYSKVAEQIESCSFFRDPAVKCETLSSGMAAALEPYRDLFWGMRWLLSPAIIITMSVVISNAISLSVRERRGEMAVLKVLGFAPAQILFLVLGEALLIGAGSGFLCTSLTYAMVNYWLGEMNEFVIFIPSSALWWGPAIGGLAALAGSLVPAWTACKVKVSEVFAKTA